MRIRALGRREFAPRALLATIMLAAACPVGHAGISNVILRIAVSNVQGSTAIEFRVGDAQWQPNGDLLWSQATPIALRAGGITIATLRSGTVRVSDDRQIDVNLALQAGVAVTRFDIESAQLIFPTIPESDADARASAAFGISDTNFDGAILRSTGAPGDGSFQGRYNGNPPAGATFTSLVHQVSVGPGGTASGFQVDPAFGYRPVNAAVSDAYGLMSFTVTAADIANVNITYEMTANGASPVENPVPGCDPGDTVELGNAKSGTLLKPSPEVLDLATLEPNVLEATVSDVELVDLSGDGRNDLVVAWYATYQDGAPNNRRVLSIYFAKGTGFVPKADIELYAPDPAYVALSIFRNGTADVGHGDFDGDGDTDLAVASFFGDELYFVENMGDGVFSPRLKFMFGFNGPAGFLTPPEMASADFDGDGRDELVYVADPIQHIDGRMLHFWRTSSSISQMERVDWEGLVGGVFTQWTRALAVDDFDGDGRPDVCFTGSVNPPNEDTPILTIWHDFDPLIGQFAVHNEYPTTVCADVVAVRSAPTSLPDLILTGVNGDRVEYWLNTGSETPDFVCAGARTGFSGLSTGRGMSAVAADVDGDGLDDLITKQRLGGRYDVRQIEVSLANGGDWGRPSAPPLSSLGFENELDNEILRPRNLAAGDVFGNCRPEIFAGFAVTPAASPFGGSPNGTIQVAYWPNSCIGDGTLDGVTDDSDALVVLDSYLYCRGHPSYNADADFNKDGCINASDLVIAIEDRGCVAATSLLADLDCDGRLTFLDVEPFVLALMDPDGYEDTRPGCNVRNGDANRDGVVDFFDVEGFSRVLLGL